eukprot:6349769-Alexandrium_andersonii.AAC.1
MCIRDRAPPERSAEKPRNPQKAAIFSLLQFSALFHYCGCILSRGLCGSVCAQGARLLAGTGWPFACEGLRSEGPSRSWSAWRDQ